MATGPGSREPGIANTGLIDRRCPPAHRAAEWVRTVEDMEQLYVDPTFPRFTRHELVAEMSHRFARAGFTDATFRKWQEKGLIAAPHRDQRWQPGRAGSADGLWSDNDRRMLIAVLELRDRHLDEVPGQFTLDKLSNFIVWSWVFWDGFVELDQVRRAVKTWTRPQIAGRRGGARNHESVQRRTRSFVDQVAAPGVALNKRTRVARKVGDCLWRNDLSALLGLVPDLASVMDPDGVGRRIGAPGLGIGADASDEIQRLWLGHIAANDVISRHPMLADEDWGVARNWMIQGWAAYGAEWRHLAAHATTPDIFRQPDVDYQMGRSCTTLLLILGQRLEARQAGQAAARSQGGAAAGSR
jgi:hypothetical protein